MTASILRTPGGSRRERVKIERQERKSDRGRVKRGGKGISSGGWDGMWRARRWFARHTSKSIGQKTYGRVVFILCINYQLFL
jgi:hypothetical protein